MNGHRNPHRKRRTRSDPAGTTRTRCGGHARGCSRASNRLRCALVLFVFCCGWTYTYADAIDPGIAEGTIVVDRDTIVLRNAYAHIHDNAEKLLDTPTELRILLVDRDVPDGVLNGLAFLPVETLARNGKVRGLLLRQDPADPNAVTVTLLYPPSSPGMSLMTTTRSSTNGVFTTFSRDPTRISGSIEQRDSASDHSELPAVSYAVRFSAPLFHEPAVTGDLRGAAARKAPQVATLRHLAAALGKGDFTAARTYLTEEQARRNDDQVRELGDKAQSFAKEISKALDKSIARITRIVVRGSRATILFGKKEWTTMDLEAGEWKMGD